MTFFLSYFFIKYYLYYKGNFQFDPKWNGLLLLFWVAPLIFERVFKKDILRSPKVLVLHRVFGVIMAAVVFWKDSYFPPMQTLIMFLSDPATRPSFHYAVGFLGGFWNSMDVLIFSGIVSLIFWLQRYAVFALPFVAVLMVIPASMGSTKNSANVTEAERNFYESQSNSKLRVEFSAPKKGAPPFDIVILHVCSVAWDDLAAIGSPRPPFLSEFDLIFTRFNTVTTYSTPAALRLSRANCGQTRHSELYKSVPNECLLMETLRQVGYSTQTVFNNTGKLAATMAEETAKFGKLDPPMDLSSLAPEAKNFDNSPLFNNFEVLKKWWEARLASKVDRSALFYNTVSLHGGAHYNGDKRWWKRDRKDLYNEAVTRTFADLSKFFELIRVSKRDVLVVLVPEHGAAINGSAIQAKDLRDIPLPKIATAPMGFKFISSGRENAKTSWIEKPVSYRSVSYLIAEVIRSRVSEQSDPFGTEVLSGVPEVPYFAENDSAATTVFQGDLYYRRDSKEWKVLPKELLATDIKTDVK